MTRAETDEIYGIIFSLASLFDYTCWVCHKRCDSGKGWTIHHRKYRKGEKMYSDFIERIRVVLPSGKVKIKKRYNRLSYLRYIAPIVRKNPKRFCLLMHFCHVAVGQNARWKPDNLERMMTLALEQSISNRKNT